MQTGPHVLRQFFSAVSSIGLVTPQARNPRLSLCRRYVDAVFLTLTCSGWSILFLSSLYPSLNGLYFFGDRRVRASSPFGALVYSTTPHSPCSHCGWRNSIRLFASSGYVTEERWLGAYVRCYLIWIFMFVLWAILHCILHPWIIFLDLEVSFLCVFC